MALDFKFPDVGEGITEGEIVKWHVKAGDTVKQDEVLVEIETDKAVVQIPSPKAGKIIKTVGKQGDTVKVGAVLVTIDETGKGAVEKEPKAAAEAPAKTEKKPEAKEAPKKDAGAVVGTLPEYEPPKEKTTSLPLMKSNVPEKHIKALPSVRKLAEEKNIDLSTITPSGADGVITKEDILHAAGETRVKTSQVTETQSGVKVIARDYDVYGYIERIPMKGVRKTIANHLMESVTKTAQVTHFDEADVTHLVDIREREKEAMAKKGVHLTYLAFVMKAAIMALKQHPYLNANVDEENGDIILKKYYNIGFAVDTPDGLIVPVVKIADKKNIEQMATEIQKLADATRRRIIDLGDLKGGTFTITNVGSIGGVYATPIINYPEVAILLPGKIADRPVVIDGKVVVRKIMPISLTFDHRIVDGAEAARFTNTLKEYLQDPDKLLLELE